MNYKFLKNLLPILSLLAFTNCYSQVKTIGLNFGYGNSVIGGDGEGIRTSNYSSLNKYKLIELVYTIKPKTAPFIIKSGLVFDNREIESNNYNLSYAKIPLGIDFCLGNKFQFVIGGGIYTGFIIHSAGIDSSITLNKFQFGGSINLGFNVQLNEKIKLLAAYQFNNDFTKTYEKRRFSPGGAPYQINMIGNDSFIKIGIAYQLNPTN